MKTLVSIFLAATLALSQSVVAQVETQETTAVMNRYFDSLSQGNTDAIRSLLGGQLLANRSALLSNPTYPAFLQQTYGGAQFEIEKIEAAGDTDVMVDVAIKFDKANVAHTRLLLRKTPPAAGGDLPQLLIVGETEPD